MGGTFNPIHHGHLLLAERAYHQFELDRVLIMPTKNTYYKEMPKDITEEQRIEMVQLAIEDNDHFKLSLEEIHREGTTYTVETLEHLTQEHPECEYYFIMGADSLYHIESWYRVEDIFRMTHIIVAGRGAGAASALDSQIDYIVNKYEAKIEKLDAPIMEIASNDIRKRIKNGKSIRYLLPQKVIDYIYLNHVYEE